MTVIDSGEGYVSCRVDVGGKLSNKKGVNTPTVRLPISAMTPKVMAVCSRFPVKLCMRVFAFVFVCVCVGRLQTCRRCCARAV